MEALAAAGCVGGLSGHRRNALWDVSGVERIAVRCWRIQPLDGTRRRHHRAGEARTSIADYPTRAWGSRWDVIRWRCCSAPAASMPRAARIARAAHVRISARDRARPAVSAEHRQRRHAIVTLEDRVPARSASSSARPGRASSARAIALNLLTVCGALGVPARYLILDDCATSALSASGGHRAISFSVLYSVAGSGARLANNRPRAAPRVPPRLLRHQDSLMAKRPSTRVITAQWAILSYYQRFRKTHAFVLVSVADHYIALFPIGSNCSDNIAFDA